MILSSAAQLRPATIDDFDVVLSLSQQLARHIESPLPSLSSEQFKARYIEPGAPMRLLLAVDGSQVVGLIAWTVTYELYSADSRLYISDLIIDRDARRKGIGAALMSAVTDWARDRGVSKLGWEVWHRNESAKTFYEGLGAVQDNEALSYLIEMPD
jgi:ribosomal protein S18 acetylase RimI-like enzyme